MFVVIPARGGSKGIPGKNIKELNGKPLIQYTIEAAREVFEDRKIIVSTDSPEIKQVVENIGLEVPFLRPVELASDNAGTHEVLVHANKFMEERGDTSEILILLQPTSPFRTGRHIQEAIETYSEEFQMIVSVKETASNPYYVLWEEDEKGFLRKSKNGNFVTRQECPKVWELNGAIYIINIASLKQQKFSDFHKIKKYVMDEISSHDIDTELDWKVAEAIVKG
ncbi:cytidylyltransferase domain-containing protein [Salinimicrobium sp. GXAS 041]|uniref:acylneuraminate cytidylyltransferase family protein n=1 Tax=Salinimicrobium sp. GXAS 041 TaxID=3400806 RepID=UPI003C738209